MNDSDQRSHVLHALRHDKGLWLASALLAVGIAPYLLLGLTTDQRASWGWYYADVPVAAAGLLAVLWGLPRTPPSRERRFWALIGCAAGAVLVAEVIGAVVSWAQWTHAWDLVVQATFLCFYLGMVLALEATRSHPGGDRVGRLLWLRTAGLGVLLLGLLMYFENIPTTVGADGVVPWSPSQFIFSGLDVIVCAGFMRARTRASDHRWRRILGGMAVVMGSHAVVDTAESIFYFERFASLQLAPLWDVPWFVPAAILVVLARAHVAAPVEIPEQEVHAPASTTLGGGPLLAYMLALPVLHSSLYAVGLLDPSLQASRSMLVGLVLLAIGSLAFLYQRTVERQNDAAHLELSISRERYESFLKTSGRGIYLGELAEPVAIGDPVERQVQQIRSRLRITEANETLAQMHGYSDPSEMLGMLFSELAGEYDHVPLRRVFVESGYEAVDLESSGEDAEGNERFLRNSVSGVVVNGALIRIWGTQVDVTEERLREREKERLENELRHSQKLETVGTLASGIAHDFNNILAPIVGFVDLATTETPSQNTRVRSYLRQIAAAARRAQELVDQILMMSRKEKGKKVPVRIQDVVEEALSLVRSTLPSTIRIETEVDHECPPVLADAGQIYQVLLNLCTNAGQAIGDAKGRVTVTLRWLPESAGTPTLGHSAGARIELTVTDDGPGMAGAVADRIFEPFFTTRDIGEGTGLGLSVAHGIVAGHGGELTVDTAPEKGARFAVYLPALEAAVAPPTVPSVRATARAEHVGQVLVVDDDEAVAAVAGAMLRQIGYEVTTLIDSREALMTLRADAHRFGLLFTDHTMPEITGPELA